MTNYLLSIIIPTRNRQRYCREAVNQILAHKWEGIEVCIQDNSDDDSLKDFISLFNSKDIVYNYHPGELSFVDNFSEAVALARGDYVCMIGDDDGVLPGILHLIECMVLEGADAAIPALNFIYFWPSNQHIVEDGENGLLISHIHAERPQRKVKVIINPEKEIAKLLSRGIQEYTSYGIPRLYHGIVKREVLEKIKETTGHYFGGLTPDIYMASALALVCQKVLQVSYSVTISGICPTSGSSDSATGKHTGQLKDAPHFRGHDHYEWDEMIPAIYSVDTIWGDTLFHSIKEFHRDEILRHFNMALFDGICITKYPEYRNVVLEHALAHGSSISKIKLALGVYKVRTYYDRVVRKIKKICSSGFGITTIKNKNLPTIIEAEKQIAVITKSVK